MFAFIVNKVGYRKASLIGTILGTVGLICSSFTTEVYQLYFTYGALQGMVNLKLNIRLHYVSIKNKSPLFTITLQDISFKRQCTIHN